MSTCSCANFSRIYYWCRNYIAEKYYSIALSRTNDSYFGFDPYLTKLLFRDFLTYFIVSAVYHKITDGGDSVE